MNTKPQSEYEAIMSYRDGVLSLWPEFERPDFLDELDNAAQEALDRDTLEGYLAAFLIYQQLSEEMLKLIINLGRVFIQCSALPLMITYKPLDKKIAFGGLIDKLDEIPMEDDNLKILCRELNTLRAQLIHKITRKSNLEEIRRKCARAHVLYAKIHNEFEHIEDLLKMGISDMRESKALQEEK